MIKTDNSKVNASLLEENQRLREQLASAVYLMRECDEYLRTNQYTNIAHNSIFHTKLWKTADKLEGKG